MLFNHIKHLQTMLFGLQIFICLICSLNAFAYGKKINRKKKISHKEIITKIFGIMYGKLKYIRG